MARFLKDTDYTTLIKDPTLQAVISENSAELPKAENMAQEEIESYLRERYDMAEAFGKEGDSRYPLLVMYMLDVTLYHLHASIARREVPETRLNRYLAAKDWLERAQAGKVTVKWSRQIDENTSEKQADYRFGSVKKFDSDY